MDADVRASSTGAATGTNTVDCNAGTRLQSKAGEESCAERAEWPFYAGRGTDCTDGHIQLVGAWKDRPLL